MRREVYQGSFTPAVKQYQSKPFSQNLFSSSVFVTGGIKCSTKDGHDTIEGLDWEALQDPRSSRTGPPSLIQNSHTMADWLIDLTEIMLAGFKQRPFSGSQSREVFFKSAETKDWLVFAPRVLYLFFTSPTLTCCAQWGNYFLAPSSFSTLPPITFWLKIFFQSA